MTPTEFTAALDALGWSLREVARRLRYDVGTPLRWKRGLAPIPDAAAMWLAGLVLLLERYPPPPRGKRAATTRTR
jgi:transcriptional regulator with XRE-family HTH domain